MMKNRGFTLVELLVVIAILSIATGLIATNFNSIIKSSDDFEDKSTAKGIGEAAYVLIDNDKDNPSRSTIDYSTDSKTNCYPATILLDNGYIPTDQGLLKNCNRSCMEEFYFEVKKVSNEKKVLVYKDSCTGTAIYTYGGT